MKKALLLLFMLMVSAAISAAELIDVKQEIIGGSHTFNPHFSLPISEKVIEAIDNGIVITFVIQASLNESVNWWFDNKLESRLNTYQVRFFSLSSLYQLHNIRSDQKLSFVNLEDLLSYLGEEVVFKFKTNAMASYFETRIFLDKQALPSIMQLPNVFDPDWNFNSDWQRVDVIAIPDAKP